MNIHLKRRHRASRRAVKSCVFRSLQYLNSQWQYFPSQSLEGTETCAIILEGSITWVAGPPRGGEQGILPQGPQTFKSPHNAFIFMICTFIGCIFTLFLFLSLSQDCLESMSEHLGRIISNSFTVSALMHVNTLN